MKLALPLQAFISSAPRRPTAVDMFRQQQLKFRGSIVLLMLLCRCHVAVPEHADNPPVITITADTMQRVYRLKDFRFFVRFNYPELEDQIDANLTQEFLNRFRRDVILDELSRFYGIRVTAEDITRFQQEHPLPALQNPSPEEQTAEDERFRQEVSRRLSIRQLVQTRVTDQTKITEDEVQAYYQTNPDLFHKDEQYLMRFMQTDNEEQGLAFKVDLELKTPPQTMLQKYPQYTGFQLAVPMLSSQLLEPFRAQLTTMTPGSASAVIPITQEQQADVDGATSTGTSKQTVEITNYHILYLEEIIPASEIPYEEARDLIMGELQRQRTVIALDTMLQKYEQNPAVQVLLHPENLPSKKP